MEDYLTKEFALLILNKSRGSMLPLINVGQRLEGRRIDLALAVGDLSGARDRASASRCRPTIRAFIELKYIRNRHRYGYGNAEDEILGTFKSLNAQLRRLDDVTEFAKYPVRFIGRKHDTYGLVFASYVRHPHDVDHKETFLKHVRTYAKAHGFVTFRMKSPRMSEIYTDFEVKALNATWLTSLYTGLWRLSEAEQRKKAAAKATPC